MNKKKSKFVSCVITGEAKGPKCDECDSVMYPIEVAEDKGTLKIGDKGYFCFNCTPVVQL